MGTGAIDIAEFYGNYMKQPLHDSQFWGKYGSLVLLWAKIAEHGNKILRLRKHLLYGQLLLCFRKWTKKSIGHN